MQIDESITQLGAKLDGWLDRSLPVFSSEGRAGQGKAILRGVKIIEEFDRLKAEGIAAITALLNRHDPVPANERNAALIRAFEFGARLGRALYDEFLDTDGERRVWRLLDGIVLALDKVGSGRVALDVLFDNPDPGVRAAAGAYLIDLVPECAAPMLREITKAERGRSAGFGAKWTLLAWEREGKSRFNYLSKPA
jgi:hypothetical protein